MIRILDAGVVGRIAAGEVVERPSSVAKELIENALDAGSTSITIEMREGGIEFLRITDNGSGIAPSEVRLAFENHATSKIRSADQLDDIQTLGFRGEALPSIASVSKIECITRQKGLDSGVKLVLEGGRFISLNETGCPEGTTIIMRDLFFNVPVRRAFLKKPSYEAGLITDVVTSLMLGNPGVAFRLINNGKTTFHSFGDAKIRHSALCVYGKHVAEQLLEIDKAQGGIRICGLIGTGDLARPNRSQQHFFINGRLVRCQLLTQALESACTGRVTISQHPICMLAISLPPNAVDVNVHPNKLEVRFRDEAGVRANVDALFQSAFEGERMLTLDDAQSGDSIAEKPAMIIFHTTDHDVEPTEVSVEQLKANLDVKPLNEPAPNDKPSGRITAHITGANMPKLRMGEPGQSPFSQRLLYNDEDTLNGVSKAPKVCFEGLNPASLPENKSVNIDAQQQPNGAKDQTSAPENLPFRIVGALFQTYLLLETEDRFLLIDQHAAHERLLYERFIKKLNAPDAAQQLLTPIIIDASPREIAQIEDNRELLLQAGFDVEPFGERSVAVRAVPFVLGKADVRPLFLEMLQALDTLKYATLEKRKSELIQMSCKHAVKGGEALTQAQIIDLVTDMLKTKAPPTCPHGRPVYRAFTKNELERMFKRQQ